MKNDVTFDGEKISVPPTLLYSLIGNHHDVRKAVSSDFKQAGDAIYLLGETHQELGASELACMLSEAHGGGIGGQVPSIDAERNIGLYRALSAAMSARLVASAHDCSDGGLATALAESCFGVDSGCTVDIERLFADDEGLDDWGALFGESLGRILVSVAPDDSEAFEAAMAGHACHHLGKVGEGDEIVFDNGGENLLRADLATLRDGWKATLDGGAP